MLQVFFVVFFFFLKNVIFFPLYWSPCNHFLDCPHSSYITPKLQAFFNSQVPSKTSCFSWIPFLPLPKPCKFFPSNSSLLPYLILVRRSHTVTLLPSTNFYFRQKWCFSFAPSIQLKTIHYIITSSHSQVKLHHDSVLHPPPAYLVYLLPLTDIGLANQETCHCSQLWNKAAACFISLHILIFLHRGRKDTPKVRECWCNFPNKQVTNTLDTEQLKTVESETQQLHFPPAVTLLQALLVEHSGSKGAAEAAAAVLLSLTSWFINPSGSCSQSQY